MQFVIGVDLGGTQVRAIRCDQQGNILQHARMRTAMNGGPDAVIQQIVHLIGEVRGDLPEEAIAGVGIGTPGPVDAHSGMVFEAPNLPQWVNVPLRSMIAERTGLSVAVGNDANSAALGEWLFGNGKGTDHFVYVTVSTGIGGGVIIDRSLLLGRKGIAGEVGHMVIQVGGPRCGCGNYGCWESLASGTALAARANEAVAAGESTSLATQIQPGNIKASDVAEAASAGDPFAIRLMEREGELIGIGLVNVLHLFSPERIALGGGVMQNADRLFPPMWDAINRLAMKPYRDVEIGVATLGDRTGVLGAAALVLAPDAHRGLSLGQPG